MSKLKNIQCTVIASSVEDNVKILGEFSYFTILCVFFISPDFETVVHFHLVVENVSKFWSNQNQWYTPAPRPSLTVLSLALWELAWRDVVISCYCWNPALLDPPNTGCPLTYPSPSTNNTNFGNISNRKIPLMNV